MTLVIDASVAAKWVLPEEDADRAAALRDNSDDLIAPSLIVAEIGNAIWKRTARKELSKVDAIRAVEIAISLLTRIEPVADLAGRALELAIDLNHPIYDCFYLALAERERCALVSADAKLLAAAKKLKGIEARKL